MGTLRTPGVILMEVRRALSMTQREFGPAVGVSHRTAVRWDAGQSHPSGAEYARMAALVHPLDAKLAADVAHLGGHTLVSLALEKPALPPAPSPAPAAAQPALPPSLPRPDAADLVDVLVLAGVDATGGTIADVRRWVHAVVKRACDVGLTMQEVEKALRPNAETPSAGKAAPLEKAPR